MKSQIDLRDPRGQLFAAVLLAVLCTLLLLGGDMDGTTLRFGIPRAVLVPLGYVLAAGLAANAARLWRRRR